MGLELQMVAGNHPWLQIERGLILKRVFFL